MSNVSNNNEIKKKKKNKLFLGSYIQFFFLRKKKMANIFNDYICPVMKSLSFLKKKKKNQKRKFELNAARK